MKEMAPKEIQSVGLGLLKELDGFCRDNNLRYYLAAGTLLGAVRHHGFIPWDDDVDVFMPRPDYERFLKIYKGQGNIELCTIEETEGYYLGYARLLDTRTFMKDAHRAKGDFGGIFLDIFPLDGIKGENWCRKLQLKLFLYKRILGRNLFDDLQQEFIQTRAWYKNAAKKVLRGVGKKLSEKDYYIRLNNSLKKTSFDQSEMVANFWGWHVDKEDVPRAYFDDVVELQFEDSVFYCPVGYKEWLTRIYGPNYMTPIQEDPEGHGKAYWRD